MKNQKFKIWIFGIILAAGAVTLINGFSATLAQELTQTPTQFTSDVICEKEMKPIIDSKSKEFRDYLTQHFQNKSTNTSLLDLALKRFELYKKELREKFNSFYPQSGYELNTEVQDTLACYKQMQNEIQISEGLMKKYFTQTSNIKTSSAVMEKLKAINKKLDKLSTAVTQMYGKWETFKNNVTCIIENCI
jgi:hypothetical protein